MKIKDISEVVRNPQYEFDGVRVKVFGEYSYEVFCYETPSDDDYWEPDWVDFYSLNDLTIKQLIALGKILEHHLSLED
jgi:hypothetical protein